jgi:hypothetical protein
MAVPLRIRRILLALVVAAIPAIAPAAPAVATGLRVESASVGVTPFVGSVTVSGVTKAVASITFKVAPKPGTQSAPVSGTYKRGYLVRHRLLTSDGIATVPVYGLYENYSNSIDVAIKLTNGGTRRSSVAIRTAAWSSDCASTFRLMSRVVSPSSTIPLDYSFFMLKGWACNAHPIVMDIDGNIRWIGTIGNAQQGSTFVGNTFYVGNGSDVYAIDLAGNSSVIGSVASGGYATFHHQIDPGRDGILMDLNRSPALESDIVEMRTDGTIANSWDIAAIVRSAMIAGGDDPSAFVRTGDDWLHNNAATYWAARNELIVSGREDFVIAIGYDDHKIKWILGDPDKAWHTYASLRAYALTLPAGTHPPIGEHAVSITSSGRLMLFDNGYASFNQWPSGSSRSASVPRQYSINEQAGVATEVWQYEHSPSVWSPICSSIYQFGTSYLVDYASEDGGIRLVGLTRDKQRAFEYKVSGSDFTWGWNALPIGFSGITFAK